ncbi:lecithin retinol acyltransferase family protein [Pseudomonas sp. Tri1]|uniref:lecithin retinol acyltransferase family protein n=1 Tax=Pseudomonas sp. Tri1 TaxID=2823875 RepID=UPI001B344A74|nr:lecithin retinol acyltransferase family protein [Pseudomonas sp. Tri1]
MNNLTAVAVDKFSSLRCIALICLALMTTSVFYRLSAPMPQNQRPVEPRHWGKLPKGLLDVSLKLVNLEQAPGGVPVGAHLVSPRRFYLHHGIYLGGAEVAHYSGFSGALKSGPIEVTDLEHFANGKPVWIVDGQFEYCAEEVANRARSRLGEEQYRIFSNNCEHFCSWCTTGESYSAQINAYLHRPRYLLALISALEPQLIA